MILHCSEWVWLNIFDKTMNSEELIRDYLEKEFAIVAKPNCSWQDLETLLSFRINELIDRDFGKLVGILYRIDVSESKLRNVLEANAGEQASDLIARLILQRQLEKMKTRVEHKAKSKDSGEEEW
jgi:hypothetical protein